VPGAPRGREEGVMRRHLRWFGEAKVQRSYEHGWFQVQNRSHVALVETFVSRNSERETNGA
jgi:hypothetical protein